MSKATKRVFRVWAIVRRGALVKTGPQFWLLDDEQTAKRCVYQPGEQAVAATLTLDRPKQKRKAKK